MLEEQSLPLLQTRSFSRGAFSLSYCHFSSVQAGSVVPKDKMTTTLQAAKINGHLQTFYQLRRIFRTAAWCGSCMLVPTC